MPTATGDFDWTDKLLNKGEYSIKGPIIDIYNLLNDKPIRINFDGDKVQSIKEFDINNQRSINEVDFLFLSPAVEFIIDDKEYFEFPENLDYEEFIIQVSFITVSNSIIKILNRVLKDCNIEVQKFISHQYSSKFADDNDLSPCIAAKKVNDGINPLEVKIQSPKAQKQGLFEKMFNFFN